jgi:hypothetical protein
MHVIDTAEVLMVRFAIIEKRLLVDTRHDAQDGPLIALVPRVGSVEERFRHLKELRPRFPLPERIMSFMWPRHVALLERSGVWQRIVDRLVSLGHPDMAERCQSVFKELVDEEKGEVVAAIRGGGSYQSLWESRA